MGFQDDWIMRQIDIIARFVANLVFNKNGIEYQPGTTEMLSETDELYFVLNRMIKEGEIGKAEDMLFDNISFTDRYIELATDFYQKLNRLSDSELEEADFSRDEVYDGYIDILTKLGVPVEQFAD